IDRHLIFSDSEWTVQCDDVLRTLAPLAIPFVARRTHGERSRWYHHHFRANVALPETILRLEFALMFRRERLGKNSDGEAACQQQGGRNEQDESAHGSLPPGNLQSRLLSLANCPLARRWRTVAEFHFGQLTNAAKAALGRLS